VADTTPTASNPTTTAAMVARASTVRRRGRRPEDAPRFDACCRWTVVVMFGGRPSSGHTGAMGPVVEAQGLTVRRGPRLVLADADFTVPPAAVTAVIGPNGSGKSTLLYLVAGLLDPDPGTRLSVFGDPPGAHRRRVALVLQSTEVSARLPLTVRDAVAMGRYPGRGMFGLAGRSRRRADRRHVDDAMERLDVTDLAGRQVDELSGGQRQRVFVAQGLAQAADILLLDEPVTGLDPVSRHTILEVVTAEAARGAAVVMTTHDLAEAAASDHVLLLSAGRVVEGPPEVVLQPDVLRGAYGERVLEVGPGRTVVVDDPHHGHAH
jgi:iron complex transport system ATP-binding protein